MSSDGDEELLRSILVNMRYVNVETIGRFLNNYRLGKQRKIFEEKPEVLLKLAQHMFGPGQGEAALLLFNAVRGKQNELS